MASASSAASLCRLACRQTPRLRQFNRTQSIAWQPQTARRAFTTTRARQAAGGKGKEDEQLEDETLDLKRMNQAFVDSATPENLQQLDAIAKLGGHNTIEQSVESSFRTMRGWSAEEKALEDDIKSFNLPGRLNRQSIWFDEDDPEPNTEEHDEFDEDDITAMAHGKLEEIREMRNYARLAVWEMPLLAKFAKPFEPPKDDQVLRWRYTTYMGEFHPAEKKVVVQFAPDDLKLTPVQTDKLKKLAGARYNPETELIKMSCESFEHQAQNKRYLSDLVDDLIAAAKDPKDTFADIPLDVRHHQFKNKPKFPKEWLLTPDRRRELDEHRQRLAIADLQKTEKGLLVDGQKLHEEVLMKNLIEEQKKEQEKVAELVAAPRSSRQSGGAARARR